MASLGDVFLRLLADANGFEADIVKKAGPAADRAGGTLGKRLGRTMSTALATGLGSVAGFAFTSMVSGANQLDAATRQLQADTGMTAAEAANAEKALAGMYRNNLQGFDAIGAAMAKVHNDLGLTGEAADAATQQFLDFSTATGQDAAQAVTAMDDVLDAFNLSAEDSTGVLDQLVASHQKFGGSVEESEAALAKLAPALTAANMGIDDGIGLLNLFNAAGVDAAKVPQAMATALKKVKSPEELKRLIADIAATKDPFDRAQKAIALFGNRAGPQLAQALSQGNLDDYIITMGEAQGATDKAADAVKSGFGAQFQLIMKNATGALAEFGTQFGPLIMLLSQVGPGVLKTFGAVGGGLAGFLAGKAGITLPGLFSRGSTPATPVFTKDVGAPGLPTSATGAAGILGAGGLAGLATISAGILGILGAYWLIEEVAKGNKPAEARTVATGPAAGTTLPATGYMSIDALSQGNAALAKAIHDNTTATNATTRDMDKNLDAAIGAASRDMDKNLGSNEAAVKLASQAIGGLGQALTQGQRNQINAAANSARDTINAMNAGNRKLDPLAGIKSAQDLIKVYTSGTAKNTQWAAANQEKLRALAAKFDAQGDHATAAKIRGYLATLQSTVATWGSRTVSAVKNMDVTVTVAGAGYGRASGRRAAGGPVLPNVPYLVGERGPEMYVPERAGTIVPSDQVGGNTYNVNVQGLLPVQSALDIGLQLRRLGDFGVLTPRRRYSNG